MNVTSVIVRLDVIFCLLAEDVLAAVDVGQPCTFHVSVELVGGHKFRASRLFDAFFCFHIKSLLRYTILNFTLLYCSRLK